MAVLTASANVKNSLSWARAGQALQIVLAEQPDLIGLQEWGVSRLQLLRRTGPVRVLGRGSSPEPRWRSREGSFRWFQPVLGGCAVGVRTERFRVVQAAQHKVTWPGRSDVPGAMLWFEELRIATSVVVQDRLDGTELALINYHLVPDSQAHDLQYHADRPRQARRHRAGAGVVQGLIDQHLGAGRVVVALGDSNFAGIRFAGLISCWHGVREPGQSHDRLSIDDIFGTTTAQRVWTTQTPSDHRALFALR